MEKKNPCKLLFAFLLSFLFITICSKNSFLYPMNDWGDVNCFFIVGRSLLDGKVLYRDIYDQKGPILYFIYALLSSISSTSFFAVYILEIITFAFFLFYAGKCVNLYIDDEVYSYLGMVIFGFVVVISKSFMHGGGLEEMLLFTQMYSIYVFLKWIKKDQTPSKLACFTIGIFCAIAFWTKFLLCGFYLGLVLYVLYHCCYKYKDYKTLWMAIKYFLLGFCIITMIPIIYFAVNHALNDLFISYFYNNLFLYSGKDHYALWICILLFFRSNLLSFSFLLILGILYVCSEKLTERYFTIFLLLLTLITNYMSGKTYDYYGMVMAPFAIFGIIFLLNIFYKFAKIKIHKTVLILVMICLIITSYFISSNTSFMKMKKSELPQYLFAKIMKEEHSKSMMYFVLLDKGFYYASEIIPSCKYFTILNIPLDEIRDMNVEYIKNNKVDFVVTRDFPLEETYADNPDYKLVKSTSYLFEGKKVSYYLYQLKK